MFCSSTLKACFPTSGREHCLVEQFPDFSLVLLITALFKYTSVWSTGRMILTGKNRTTGRKPGSCSTFCTSHIDSHGLEPGPQRCVVYCYGVWQSPTWTQGFATPKTTIMSLKLLLARYHPDDETRVDGSVRSCSTTVGEMHTGFWWGNLKERNHLEDLGVAGG